MFVTLTLFVANVWINENSAVLKYNEDEGVIQLTWIMQTSIHHSWKMKNTWKGAFVAVVNCYNISFKSYVKDLKKQLYFLMFRS